MLKRGVPKYLMYFGLVLVLLTLINLFISDVYPEHQKCGRIIEPLYTHMQEGEGLVLSGGSQTSTGVIDDATAALILRCNNIQNDLFISYGMISVGVAFLIGGIITIKEEK